MCHGQDKNKVVDGTPGGGYIKLEVRTRLGERDIASKTW